jgi:anti-sigma factor RsiW
MRCDEAQSLQGAYLDSELEAATSLQIEQHLNSCPECARQFAEQERLEAWLKTGLNRGQRTASLWEQAEQAVFSAGGRKPRAGRPRSPNQLNGYDARAVLALFGRLRAGWGGLPKAWSALAAAWVIIFALHFTAHEVTPARTRQDALSASELRSALEQRQRIMTDLALALEPAAADQPKTASPAPRSSLDILYERKA